ncbi:uncharacterized protein TRIADDRAFT_52067 [Trichoplax adhaerens]|uniref:Sorting nexin n=1 Tax=Trichoplax adhaerens TaxID=10228 RepID=B3RLN7_TRIAD|nr:hypothetical protein TRIADDRAFT_52067 [Trichoplax adhaerens]EDV28817.1 hypothetical protein TRIADDRAFT_52067 [Trichoplax adhaerens]|eukprot:XP_002108019.1 hypothetical protein TRIADDRAFT_52067 [Trichoplax adhaerens]
MSQPTQFRLLYDFYPESPSELEVLAGTIVSLYESEEKDELWTCIIREDGKTGFVPTSYLEPFNNSSFPEPNENTTENPHPYSDADTSSEDEPDGLSTVTNRQETVTNTTTITGSKTDASRNTVSKSLIARSPFAIFGAERFLRGEENKLDIQKLMDYEKHIIVVNKNGLTWKPAKNECTYRIGSTETDSKYAGAKTYTTYKIHPIHGDDEAIRRRYKQFDWLYGRLVARFPTIAIPKLPEKRIRGRFSEDIIQMRKELLETWLNRLARHPIINESQVFSGFLKKQDQIEWKEFKRRMEKDPGNYSGFFARTEIKDLFNNSLNSMLGNAASWEKLTKNLQESISHFREVLQHHSTDFARCYQDEYVAMGKAIGNLSSCFQSENHYPEEFKFAVKSVGDIFSVTGKEFHNKQVQDAVPLRKGLDEYLNLLSSHKQPQSITKDTLKRLKEARKHQNDSYISGKCAVVYATVEAEMNHFQQESIQDISELMMRYLRFQIAYHKTVTRKFEQSLESFMRFSGKTVIGESKDSPTIDTPPQASTNFSSHENRSSPKPSPKSVPPSANVTALSSSPPPPPPPPPPEQPASF